MYNTKTTSCLFPMNLPTHPRPGSGRPFLIHVKRNLYKSMSYRLSECTTFRHKHNLYIYIWYIITFNSHPLPLYTRHQMYNTHNLYLAPIIGHQTSISYTHPLALYILGIKCTIPPTKSWLNSNSRITMLSIYISHTTLHIYTFKSI